MDVDRSSGATQTVSAAGSGRPRLNAGRWAGATRRAWHVATERRALVREDLRGAARTGVVVHRGQRRDAPVGGHCLRRRRAVWIVPVVEAYQETERGGEGRSAVRGRDEPLIAQRVRAPVHVEEGRHGRGIERGLVEA